VTTGCTVPPKHPMDNGLSLYPRAEAVSLGTGIFFTIFYLGLLVQNGA